MVELIDKRGVVDKLTALENEFQHYKPFHGFEHAMYRKLCEVEIEIGKMVAVEVEPVVHAHWVTLKQRPCGSRHDCYCSACGQHGTRDYERCPGCGAHMDEEVADG